jgi:hypothetical protein
MTGKQVSTESGSDRVLFKFNMTVKKSLTRSLPLSVLTYLPDLKSNLTHSEILA